MRLRSGSIPFVITGLKTARTQEETDQASCLRAQVQPRRAASLLAGCGLVAIATPTAAQIAEQVEGDRDVIFVTATKRDSTIQDVPFSINAQTQEDIQKSGAGNLEDPLRNVAGLSGKNVGPCQNQVSVRSVSAGSPDDEALFGSFQSYDDESLWNYEAGVEAEVGFSPTPGLDFIFSGSLIEAEFRFHPARAAGHRHRHSRGQSPAVGPGIPAFRLGQLRIPGFGRGGCLCGGIL